MIVKFQVEAVPMAFVMPSKALALLNVAAAMRQVKSP
jgi:hypothetical protein